jgi:hypothetical protein
MKTDMDARNEEKRRRKMRRRLHITIEKELYICALTNLPEQHTHYGGESSIFYFSSLRYSPSHFFCRECH